MLFLKMCTTLWTLSVTWGALKEKRAQIKRDVVGVLSDTDALSHDNVVVGDDDHERCRDDVGSTTNDVVMTSSSATTTTNET